MRRSQKYLLTALGCLIVGAVCVCPAQKIEAATVDNRNLLVSPEIKTVYVLSQDWSDNEARQFYNLTQGSRILPYAWFLHLEQEDSTNLFRNPEHIRLFGYLPRSADSLGNP